MDTLKLTLVRGGGEMTWTRSAAGTFLVFTDGPTMLRVYPTAEEIDQIRAFLNRATPISAPRCPRMGETALDPVVPTLPPIGTWGQYGDTYQGDLFVRPAVVQMHQNETQFEVLYFRWGTWLSRVVSLAPILTPGCWSPLPTWAP